MKLTRAKKQRPKQRGKRKGKKGRAIIKSNRKGRGTQ
jgi:hypothetical protein